MGLRPRPTGWLCACLSSAPVLPVLVLPVLVLPVLLLPMFLLTGCADPRGLQPTRTLTNPQTLVGSGMGHTRAAQASAAWPDVRWWQAFGDPALSALVERALADQPSLQQALARARQAATLVDATQAGSQPQVALSAELTDQRFTAKGAVPPALAGATRWNNTVQLGARWSLDLFGRQRAALDAAVGQQRAAEADAQAARVLLAAEVARRWVALARQLDRQALAGQALQLRLQAQSLVRQRVGAGLDNALDGAQAEARVSQARSALQALADGIARERHALAELSGQGPQALAALTPALAPLRSAAPPATLGADLLGRRADLVAQRWRVEAALRDVDLARTRFYPDIDLVAFAGLSSLGLDQLLNAGARTYGAGPALRLPVFDGGRLRAQLAARSAEADAAIEGWNGALLRALREAADALATLQALQPLQSTQAEALATAEAARALAAQRQAAGLTTALTVLAADEAVLNERRAAHDLHARQLGAEVALIEALGGGYQAPASGPLARAPATTPTRP
jgi:NodT family efflux transporter outer membrane factor (OMF) lipoprotein